MQEFSNRIARVLNKNVLVGTQIDYWYVEINILESSLMSSLTQDSIGLFSLNYQLVDQLKNYLSIEETKLSVFILSQFFPNSLTENTPALPHSSEVSLLSVTHFLKDHFPEIQKSIKKTNFWKESIPIINNALWEFTEIIQDNIFELFQRTKQLEIIDWNDENEAIIVEIKNLLLLYTEELSIAIKNLEGFLQKLRGERGVINRLRNFFGSILDKNLLINLLSSKIFLSQNYEKFCHKYELFKEIDSKINRKSKRFKNYVCFSTMDKEFRKQVLNLYKMVKLWQENKETKIFERIDFFKIIKQKFHVGLSYLLLKRYLNSITKSFFTLVEEWKFEKSTLQKEKIEYLEVELNSLIALIESYRSMLLGTDPNPYVRTRLGFRELIVGNEPKITKDLQRLIYDCEDLKGLFEKFMKSSNRDYKEDEKAKQSRLKNAINAVLHEMGQPLASRGMIQTRAKKLIELLDECDEIGGSAGDMEIFITDTLLKAFQIDWHYQVLFDDPKFNELWKIHFHSEKKAKDFSHEKRMIFFRKMIYHIEDWVKQNDAFKHIHDLETDISDAKEQLQEYLSFLKRRLDSLDDIERSLYKDQVKIQLLEYYELFDRFFTFLKKYEVNGKVILNQFQFIGQYLEAIRGYLQNPID